MAGYPAHQPHTVLAGQVCVYGYCATRARYPVHQLSASRSGMAQRTITIVFDEDLNLTKWVTP
jgi:hypothetical protein